MKIYSAHVQGFVKVPDLNLITELGVITNRNSKQKQITQKLVITK